MKFVYIDIKYGGHMTIEILAVLIILFLTILLLVFEVFRIDLVAVLCMLALGWTGILTPSEALSGFSVMRLLP